MAKALFSMPSNERSKIQEKIPLKILKRLKEIYEASEQNNGNEMIRNSESMPPYSSQAFIRDDLK